MFNVFRRSASVYWCYQEPLNERLVQNARREGGFLVASEKARLHLRHPEMDKPYMYEFEPVKEAVLSLYRPGFAYQEYFNASEQGEAELLAYLKALQDGARGRPVFQFCRSAGRVRMLRERMPGTHLFLLRNPWDQWWSYRSDPYFFSRNLFIVSAPSAPAWLQPLKQAAGLPPLTDVSAEARHDFYSNRRLAPEGSYLLFYALWCHAMLEAVPECHLLIDMDRLSCEQDYCQWAIGALKEQGVEGVDLSDCTVPRAMYSGQEADFFTQLEDQVHKQLLAAGVDAGHVGRLAEYSRERADRAQGAGETVDEALLRDAARARLQVMQVDREFSHVQSELFRSRARMRSLQVRASVAEERVRELQGGNRASPDSHH